HCHGRDFIQAAMAAWRDAIVPDAHPTTLVATVPGQHMFGLESAVLLPLGCPWVTVLEERPFYPTDIVRVLESVPNRRVLITTPLHLRALLEQKIALPEIYRIVTATAPLAPELAIAAEAACGAQVIEVFGSTETGMIATRKTARATSYTVRSDTIVTLNDAGTGALV
ncbi:MAG TPA: AMP-ligase, partial [Rhodospirillaceae bacterium]|nr:AMP-ligase [Rhodospirillaceae bacterium]